MSPQIMTMLPYSSKADVWSLGVLTYNLITGKRPFNANNLNELVSEIDTGAYVMPYDPKDQ